MKMYRVKKYRKFPKTKSKGSSYTNCGQLEGGSNFIAIPYKDIPECCYIAKSEDYE